VENRDQPIGKLSALAENLGRLCFDEQP
jgi:hypothetical protein